MRPGIGERAFFRSRTAYCYFEEKSSQFVLLLVMTRRNINQPQNAPCNKNAWDRTP